MKSEGTVILRGRLWWMQYYENGELHRETTNETDEAKARKILAKRIAHLEAGLKVGGAFERTTLGELLDDVYTNYQKNDLRSLERAKKAGWHLLGKFGANIKAKNIAESQIDKYAVERKNDDGAANGTINRELSLLRRAFKLGERCRKVARVPAIEMLPEQPREGFIEYPQFLKLREALPEDLRDPVTFLYLSGWRVSEMRSLEWRDIDRTSKAIRLRSENSKNKSTRLLKPGAELWAVVERAAARQIPEVPNVFHRDGKAIALFRKSWITATKAAGLPGLLVHDMRRSAVRNLVRSGTDSNVVMKITGHKTRSIFDRYDITSEQDIENAGAKLDAFITAQPKKTADVIPFRKAS